uniref:Pentatricopeptide repeat-containing protein n=1 Tax=Kalanchoe fedtschenkoi TaxID=63787 RepID=A0A7N0THL1_KALFE
MPNTLSGKAVEWTLSRLSNQSPCNSRNAPSLSALLQKCTDASYEKQARAVHSQIISNGYAANLTLGTKVVIFYAKIGSVQTARKVFDAMTERSVVTWTAMLSGYSQCGRHDSALRIYSDMRRAGVRGTQFTYGSVLRACTRMGRLDLGMQIQGCVQKTRFYCNVYVQSGLVDLHSKCGKMEDARYLFEMMSERDLVCWNTVIGGYAVRGFGNEAFCMLRSMLREGLFPDGFTFGGILRAPSGGDDLLKVSQIQGLITKHGFGSHDVVMSSLIDGYAKCGNVRRAHRLYSSLSKKGLISCTALITGYARDGRGGTDALYLFKEIKQMDVKMDGFLLCSVLKICSNVASLSIAKQVHALALKHQHKFDSAMDNALVDMYSKCGEIGDARRAFDEMGEKNVKSWTCLIAGYARNGEGDSALELFQMMESNGLKPNDLTFLAVLFACSHNGMTSQGLESFSKMINVYNIVPRAEHYSCMADLLARGGQLDEAYDLISKMNIKPKASLWRAILGASTNYGNTSLGETAAKHLFDLNPDDPSDYVSLSSVYSEAGMWENATKVRDLIEKKRLRKLPGYSVCQSTQGAPLLLPA